jgi:hypothetical protein
LGRQIDLTSRCSIQMPSHTCDCAAVLRIRAADLPRMQRPTRTQRSPGVRRPLTPSTISLPVFMQALRLSASQQPRLAGRSHGASRSSQWIRRVNRPVPLFRKSLNSLKLQVSSRHGQRDRAAKVAPRGQFCARSWHAPTPAVFCELPHGTGRDTRATAGAFNTSVRVTHSNSTCRR